jgi:hypothetical protein
MAITLVLCQIVPRDYLGWTYSIDNYEWQPHLIFVLQYLLAGSAVVSVIMFVKTIPFSLFPGGHGNSTLAIYEWHWPVANFLAWGNLPFTGINITANSFVQYCFSHWSPFLAVFMAHAICYGVCFVLGSRTLWDKALRYVCDPQWACRWLFPKQTVDADAANNRSNSSHKGQVKSSLPPV